MDEETPCYFLTRLPGELRALIYEHVLAFERPLKLRQVVAGSPNTGILRANRQVHNEALPLLYDLNNIMVTRNDFCHYTDYDLQTPLRRDQVRHLLVKNFSQSIKCSSYSGGNHMYLAGCCEVCQPTAVGFINALSELPRLQSVVVDYHFHQSEFGYMKDVIKRNGMLEPLRRNRSLQCTGLGQWRLQGTSISDKLSITFADVALNTLWTIFSSFGNQLSIYGIPNEPQILEGLREDINRDLPDKLFFIHCARKCVLWPVVFEKIAETWKAVDDAKAEGRDASEELEALTNEVLRFCRRHTAEDARMQLQLLRLRVRCQINDPLSKSQRGYLVRTSVKVKRLGKVIQKRGSAKFQVYPAGITLGRTCVDHSQHGASCKLVYSPKQESYH
ncbi:uncharacterized protein MYCFIDRAFT_176375 [Pseudocercospora fijiensis CIRAD86]|uniref:F-box domain-containing protein n=1 Tax=Pseudocercospora fijiensis (strain CIRAD86) TaxID=383855 RepID=M3A8S8_PSEFD|nr:uncharacterized protein MYCFIDRAFT_176375 [Pseudocercospora fijiensis CIRAD86]EME81031.1 hypothetical protein MYCFIDRAFT_176375 [Pseudocercospora fijiensis CIRAD86]